MEPVLISAIETLELRRLLAVYFVAPTGSDRSHGTLDAPFQTIQHAAAVARPGDVVLIRGGIYRETITPARSGTSSRPITFAAYNNEPVVISGTDPIIGWSNLQGSIYQASMPWDLGSGGNQVFVDGQPINEARWPASSLDLSKPTYAHAADITATTADGTNASTAALTDPALTQPSGFWDGATIRIAPGQGWAFQSGTVTSSMPGSLTFQFTSDIATRPYTTPSAGNAYALIGTANALSAAGEFFRNSSGSLEIWTPAGDSPAAHDVQAQHRQYGFNLAGRANIHLIALTLFADTIATDARSHNLVFDTLDIQYPNQVTSIPDPWTAQDGADNSGLALYGSGNNFKDSTLAFSAGNGVLLDGSNNTVQGSTIHDTNNIGANFAAVTVTGSGAAVLDNTIYNAGRDGIRISGGTGVRIINNVVHDVMLQTTDGGGIYTFGTDGTRSEIGYNQVYNVVAGGFGGAGIYLDNGDQNWLVDHNTVWNTTHALKLNPPNTNDRIDSNILANSTDSVATSGSGSMPGTVFSNNTFTNAVNLGPGATEQGNTRGASYVDPPNPTPNASLGAQNGSFTPTPNPGAALAAAEQALQTDMSRLSSDTAARAAGLAADEAAIRSALAAGAVALKNDQIASKTTRAADLAAARVTSAADKVAIRTAQAALKADRGNPTATAADQGQLTAARAKLAADAAASRSRQIADAAASHATLHADEQLLKGLKVHTGSGAAPQVLKLNSDRATWAATLAADKAQIRSDKTQLAKASVPA